MNIHPYFRSLCRLVIGLAGIAATAGTPWAADIGAPVVEKSAGGTVATQPQAPPTPAAGTAVEPDRSQGLQGPIRQEPGDQAMARVDRETMRRDLDMKRYPMSNQAGIP